MSHDREFLNSVTTDIIHLHDERLHYYRGNFAQVGGTANAAVKGDFVNTRLRLSGCTTTSATLRRLVEGC